MSYHPLLNSLIFPNGFPPVPGLSPSPPLPPAPIFPPQYLFHYTDQYGMNSIMMNQFIRKSFPAHIRSSACYGEGVYLTSIPPEAPNHYILHNNWNNGGPPFKQWSVSKIAKLQYCFAIPINSLCPWTLHKILDRNGRDIWVYKQGIPLSNVDFFLKRRW